MSAGAKSKKVSADKYEYFNRELSWLSFNYRVLQEAKDPTVPLFERMKFLAIYSSNLDEFFRVRVAGLRSIIELKKKTIKKLDYDPQKILKKVLETVGEQQEEFGGIFENKVINELKRNNIYIIDETELNDAQAEFVKEYFKDYVRPWLRPMLIVKKRVSPFLKNNALYLLIKLVPKESGKESKSGSSKNKRARYANVEIPTDHVPRFIKLNQCDERHCVMFLDDIIRYNLDELFPGYKVVSAHSVKLTRDADLYIEDEYSGNLVKKIKKNLQKRRTGLPSRFLYDKNISEKALSYFREAFGIRKEDLMAGDRYHNYSDFFSFPKFGRKDLEYEPLPPLPHPKLNMRGSLLDQVESDDYLIHVPYQSYDQVLRFIEEAAEDPDVLAIKITLYRVASRSKVVKALIKAAQNGKDVTVFSEVKARFDELSNIVSAEKLEEAGANVLYSLPGLKVHSKICLVTKRKDGELKRYAYLATGNFNEVTAKLYCDIGYFTSNPEITEELNQTFQILGGLEVDADYKKLLVAPVQMRKKFVELIDYEIEAAKKGEKAEMILKMNSLEDQEIITKLYDAHNAGVKIRLIVRGICCLITDVKGMSEKIKAISIVDRFLEHTRIYHFFHGGEERIYLASADWMSRNLSRRIEIAFPIEDTKLKKELMDILKLQLKDNVKARVLNREQNNPYHKSKSKTQNRSQMASYEYYKKKLSKFKLRKLKISA